MPLTVTQNLFLANSTNKTRFIELLSRLLNDGGIQTTVADKDADRLTVQTPIDVADDGENKKVFVVREDTYLLVLLVGLPSSSQNLYFWKPGRSGAAGLPRKSRALCAHIYRLRLYFSRFWKRHGTHVSPNSD